MAEPGSAERDEGRRGRRGGRAARAAQAPEARPFRQPRRRFPPVEIVSADELEALHEASLGILEEIGMDFLDADARAILAQAGERVESGSPRVRLDRGLVLEAVAKAPPRFTLHARNAARDLEFGADNVIFAQVASAPNCSDADRGRRPGNHADFRDLVRLAQCFDAIHMTGGYPVEPVDLHA